MKFHLSIFCTLALVLLAGCRDARPTADVTPQPDAPIVQVPFTDVHLTDAFWAPRMEVNRTVSIPSAFHECEVNGRFDNFAIAGGLKEGEHRGDFSFDDTDPYKIIEGASYSLAVKYDAQLDHYLDSVITLIAAAQEPDGYLTTCVTNQCDRLRGWWGRGRWDRINSHELYNSGHLYEAAVAHYMATGKRSLLDVALRNADLVCQVFGPDEGQIHRPSGHPIIEMALCKLYKVTGDEKYLRQARYFVEETGRCTDGHQPSMYSQDHMPILEQDEIVGHAVRAGYLYSGVADVAALTHDTAYQAALGRIWDNMASKKLFITGGIGSRPQGEGFGPNYELGNHTAYCETCAAIANVYWNHRMFLATGDARYVDVYERALYNGVISGVSLSGNRFFYDNPLESFGEHERAPWFGCACCPGNVTRFMASIPYYMYATQADDVYVNLYIQSTAHVHTTNRALTLDMQTGYPWDGNITLTLQDLNENGELRMENGDLAAQAPSQSAGNNSQFSILNSQLNKFSIRLRIPSWLNGTPVGTDLYEYLDGGQQPTVRINGRKVHAPISQGYLTLSRQWKAGDVITLSLPMDVRRIRANEQAEDDRGKLAVQRGPIVYCLEGKDQPDGAVFDKYIPADATFTAQYADTLLGGVMTLTTHDGSLAPLTLIPYATWCNRGSDEMEVWIPQSEEFAHAKPASTIASRAQTVMLRRASIQKDAPAVEVEEWAGGVNDQWEPRRSSDNTKPYHYWWLRFGTEETLAYFFDKAYDISSTDVYWLDFDHYDGDFRVPASWRLYYLPADDTEPDGHAVAAPASVSWENGSDRHRPGSHEQQWVEVEATSPLGVAKDQYNHVTFAPVHARGLKMVVQLQPGKSGGVIEWKVGEEKAGSEENE